MKTLMIVISIVLVIHLSTAHAVCQWSSIAQQGDNYIYNRECHTEVGKMMKREKEKDLEIVELKKAIEWGDLSLEKANKRVTIWQDSTYQVEDKFLKLEKAGNAERWLWFGAGIVVMGAATYGAAKLIR